MYVCVFDFVCVYVRVYVLCVCGCLMYVHKYVTGFWKTNQNVTLGLFHFIAPAKSHIHPLPVHSCITSLSWLICISVQVLKSRLRRQWCPWRALDEGYGSDMHPVLMRHLLGSLGLSGPMTNTSWTQSYYKQSFLEGMACLRLPTTLRGPQLWIILQIVNHRETAVICYTWNDALSCDLQTFKTLMCENV